jgi:triacylglycerol esterase/lipase EstA (alpha/beta hydrolase family)
MHHPSFRHNLSFRKKIAAAAGAAGTAVAVATLAGAVPASAATAHATSAQRPAVTSLAVNWNFANAFTSTFSSPTASPPGSNNIFCRSSAHPFPVVLVHGTFENQNDNWQAASPILANHGYCVFALNYGGGSTSDNLQGTGDIPTSARQLATFVNAVLFLTGASKVDIVGHSQGGMMPRYYIKNLGGAAKVDKLVALSPSNHGTTLSGLTSLGQVLGLLGPVNSVLSTTCAACVQQEVGSSFLTALNNGSETAAGVRYTVIQTTGDEVVTPYTSAFLSGPDVTNITVQNQCSQDQSDHLEIANDPIAMADMLNALDPLHPVTVPCIPVQAVTGPTGPVPSF